MSWGKGQRLDGDRYEILERIGTGGFGVTYKAIDRKAAAPGEFVAIKTLNEKRQRQTNFKQLQDNFLNEAMALAKCSHPCVIRVDRVFSEDNLWAMVMEYAQGESLEDLILEQGRLTEYQAVEVVQKIGMAVSYVHDRGFLHRDIKPANIMMRSNGEPVLIDFRLARAFVVGMARSMTSDKSPHYAPPEQSERQGEFLPTLDVYALAATLYRCVTGDLPALAEIRAMRDNLVPPQERNPQVSDRVNGAILQGMALNAGERSATVAEWLELVQPSEHKKFTFEVAEIKFGGLLGKEPNIIKRTGQAEYFVEDLGGGVLLEMVSIPKGSFQMGSPVDEEGHYGDEGPQRLVQVPAFYMGRYVVTQWQYHVVTQCLYEVEVLVRYTSSHFKEGDLPVESVSWDDAQKFCAILSRRSGKKYRLPSEAEWEYACRAGTTTPFHFGETIDAQVANYRAQGWKLSDPAYPGEYGKGELGIFREKTTAVGALGVANDFGLSDMHGNVWEWCEDIWHENYRGAPSDGSAWINSTDEEKRRLLRGGSWSNYPRDCRSAYRHRWYVDHRYRFGFRVVVSHEF